MRRVILPSGGSRHTVLEHLVRTLTALPDSTDYEVTFAERDEARSLQQNNLQHQWHGEAAAQLRDESPEDKRAYCKLHFGVPILRAESESFRVEYDRVIRPLPYETKLALMKEPFDFPVTRLMTKKQKKKFLDAIYQHYTCLGVRLSHPDDLGRAA